MTPILSATDSTSLGFWITSLTGGLHTVAALLALILGPVMFIRAKGDKSHRMLGRVWFAAMIVLNVSALMTYELGGRPNLFHFFAVVSLLTLGLGGYSIYRYTRTREPKYLADHLEYMGWAYFGLAAAGVWQVVISLARVGAIDIPYPVLFTSLGILTGVTSFGLLLWYRLKSGVWSKAQTA